MNLNIIVYAGVGEKVLVTIGTSNNLPVIETAVEFWTPEVDEAKDKTDAHKSEDWTKSKN